MHITNIIIQHYASIKILSLPQLCTRLDLQYYYIGTTEIAGQDVAGDNICA